MDTGTYQDLQDRQLGEEAALFRGALSRHGWALGPAGRELGLTATGLQRALLRRHPEIEAERRREGPRPGGQRRVGL